MEKEQQERLKRIATRTVLAIGSAAIYTHRDEILGHARTYPAGSFILDVIKGVRENSIRLSGSFFRHESGELEIEVDPKELNDNQIDELDDMFSAERLTEDSH